MRRRGFIPPSQPALLALAGLMAAVPAFTDAARAVETTRDAGVVGTVDGQPILVTDVVPHLRPEEPWVGTEPPPDPRRLAWDAAVRLLLFDREARRRGIDGGTGAASVVAARRVQKLIAAELERRGVGAPDDEALRRFHDEHRLRLSPVVSARIAAVVVADRVPALDVLARAASADDEAFARLVAAHSLDRASRERAGHLAQIDRHGRGLPPALARVALALKAAGAVGLAQADDGRYYVLRATNVELEVRPWAAPLIAHLRELIAYTQREAALDDFAAGLRRGARVELDEAALARLAIPSWRTEAAQ